MDDMAGVLRRYWTDPVVVCSFLALIRLAMITTICPMFGGAALPNRVRLAIAIVLAIAVGRSAATPSFVVPAGGALFAAAFREAAIGAAFAVMLRIVFELAAAAGSIIDLSRGATNPFLHDTSGAEQTSVLAAFMGQAVLVLLFSVGGHRDVVRGIFGTFRTIPLGGDEWIIRNPEGALATVGELFRIAVRVGSPIIATIFLVDVVVGLAGRIAPQIQVYFTGMLLKGTIGIAVLALCYRPILVQICREMLRLIPAVLGG